jgi:hypothetical protein
MSGERTVVLDEPVGAVALGQTAVVYQGDAVVLAGTIVGTRPWPTNKDACGGEQIGPVV